MLDCDVYAKQPRQWKLANLCLNLGLVLKAEPIGVAEIVDEVPDVVDDMMVISEGLDADEG